MRKRLIAGNWKMNCTPTEAQKLVAALKDQVANSPHQVLVCPTAVCLDKVTSFCKDTNIMVGAQNVYLEDAGAYTGEISCDMLLDLGVTHVILGHSERRAYFGETDGFINKKVTKCLEKNLTPILCIGETLEQRESGITDDLLRLQTKLGFQGLNAQQAVKVVIAYEPVWAIGTGKTATDQQAEEACALIRRCIADIYDAQTAEDICILYGGSVNAENGAGLFACENIDGGLVGGASLKPDQFAVLCQ